MYIPKAFAVDDRNQLLDFIKANAFGQLISHVEDRLFATHIPFLVSDDGQSLLCHIAKINPQWKDIPKQEVMITFQGPHDYISPSWYQSGGVPTWNYQAVHVYGAAKTVTDAESLKKIVNDLTHQYETRFEKPWQPEYNENMLRAIVGIEIKIHEIQGKYKLSQNRSEQDRLNVINELEQRGAVEISKAMKKEC